MANEVHVEVLWKLIVSRDRTLVGAHRLSEIRLLEKEEDISQKEVVVERLKREADARMEIIKRLHEDIDQLKRSYYYRLGYVLLYPLVAAKKLFWLRADNK